MALFSKAGGQWLKAKKIFSKNSGNWREVKFGYVKKDGGWRLFYTAEVIVYYTQSRVDVNVYNDSAELRQSWNDPNVKKRIVINPNVTIGSTSPNHAAIDINGGWSGELVVENYGSIIGAGGDPWNHPDGGWALWVGGTSTEGYKSILNNYGSILAGGGCGGTGGTGGKGGNGIVYYDVWEGPTLINNYTDWKYNYRKGGWLKVYWGGNVPVYWVGKYPNVVQADGNDGWTYFRDKYGWNENDDHDHWYVKRKQTRSYGTSGGWGGAGGRGGYGRGYNQNQTAGSSGAGGNQGEQNAGWGGAGGAGGWGGDYGRVGDVGAGGARGNDGNASGGEWGTAGLGGGNAGIAFNSIIMNLNVNSGTIAGRWS